jgi:flagellar hook-basal body complex protein FliE
MNDIGAYRAIDLAAPDQPVADEVARPASASFSAALGNAIDAVDQLQLRADTQAQKVALGEGNLHEMTLALQEADIGMRFAMRVRNKVVDAYQEIMKMAV